MDRLTFDDHVTAGLTPGLADKLAEALEGGHSVLLTGPADPRPLFAAATRHPCLLRATVFHVGPPLDLISMLRQVTADDGPRDATLEQGFDLLTAPSAGCERIVLFVAEAHLLPHATLRYIEFALHAGPHLMVVLAGQDGLMDTLALDGFAGLRNRIATHLVLPDAGPAQTDLLPTTSVPDVSNLALTYRMTPSRLLVAAAAAAGLAAVGMVSLSPSAPPVTAVLAEPAAPPVAAVEPPPEPASTQPAPVAVADSSPAPDTSAIASQQAPAAALLSSPAAEAEATLADEASAATGTMAVNAPALPLEAASGSTLEVTALPPGAPSHADFAESADAPAQPETAQAGIPGLLPGTPESGPEVAEVPEVQPAMPSEPPAAMPDQADAPDPSLAAGPAAEAAARQGNATNMAAALPPAAQLTVPMPAARKAQAAVMLRARTRSTFIRPERVMDRLPTPSGDGQHCRTIILRLQIGETPTDGERAYLRNGCQ